MVQIKKVVKLSVLFFILGILIFSFGCTKAVDKTLENSVADVDSEFEAIEAIGEIEDLTDVTEQMDDEEIEEISEIEDFEDLDLLNTTESNNENSSELLISGSLDLQNNLEMCPHLKNIFKCDKYDLRYCEYSDIITELDFYPNVLNCRIDGTDDEGDKYCLIQECRPLAGKDGIVYGYGGKTAYTKYRFFKESVVGGIELIYDLKSCGETTKEFKTEKECYFYKSKVSLP